MRKGLRWKIILVAAVILLSLFLSYPPGEKINLGLDLEGGMHLVFQVVTDDAINIETDQEITRLQDQLKRKNIEYEMISKGELGKFSIQKFNPDQEGQLRGILDDYFKEWNYSIIGSNVNLSLRPNVAQYIRDQSVNHMSIFIFNIP